MLGLSELGQHLKEAREQKQISLDDLQQTTKIQKRYLIAIEEGRFDTLPGIFYARAFVKTYAEAIGLDPEPLFDQYRDELPNPQREAANLPSRAARTKPSPKKRTKKGSFVPAIVAILFIVLIVVGIWVMAQGSGTRDDDAIAPDDSENLDAEFSLGVGTDSEDELEEGLEEEEEEEEVETIEPEPVEEVPEPSSTLSFTRSEGNTSFYELENGRLTDVRIELSGRTYIDVKNALGRVFFSGEPSNTEDIPTLDLEAEERVIFNFGASQHVDLLINGEPFEFPLDITHQKVDITILDEASE
ncbi:helix-turn-helix domain-containing protein [Halalkalibacter alkalisediminis]|uniref:Helix-turn-helix domain-containing protein n=1 Tax=Halalkalibacter alkalisediminis TaxID=935616 RepID=A0ABV6NCN5_9BACI|nr:helix-turn-helix domain-containing protein [Halalkalibacter alkalisediminis]